MINKLFLSIICALLFISTEVCGQTYKSVQLITPQNFYLNSGTRLGGKPRLVLKFDLPYNTVEWYYVFSTSRKDNTPQTSDLIGKVTNLVQNPNYELKKMALSSVFTPTGEAVCDIYLSDKEGADSFLKQSMFGNWEVSNPKHWEEGTRQNAMSGLVRVDDVTSGTFYLCLRNPSATDAVNLVVEIVAIVKE